MCTGAGPLATPASLHVPVLCRDGAPRAPQISPGFHSDGARRGPTIVSCAVVLRGRSPSPRHHEVGAAD
eukprot:11214593-Lingulodinium_polyedra.AAC.1